METLLVEKKSTHWDVTINRPKVLNALNQTVIAELTQIVADASKAPSVRAMVLRGAGDKAFVAGADIAAMLEMSAHDALTFARKGQALTTALENAPFVTIALVHGFALGGGCELAMACDVVLATTAARFGQPEVDLGLIAGFGGTQRLVKRVGPVVAMDILCCGRKLSGEEAARLGLAAQVVAPGEEQAALEKILAGVNKGGPHALRETKRLVREASDMPLAVGLSSEAASFAACFAGEEAREGLSAFLEKRKAGFSK